MDLTLLPLGWLHSLACLLALALGPVILATRKGGVRHRRLGQVYLGAQAALNLSALGIYRLGVFFFPHVLAVVTLAEAAEGQEGRATSSLQLSDMLGTALGAGVGGVLVAVGVATAGSDTAGLVAVYGLGALVAVGGVLLARRVPGRRSTALP